MSFIALFDIIHGSVLFQLIFTFIYSTFSKKISVSVKEAYLKQALIMVFLPHFMGSLSFTKMQSCLSKIYIT